MRRILAVIISVAILIGIVWVAFSFFKKEKQGKEISCTAEARVCPDGSTVGRSGPKCEFSLCPRTILQTENIRINTPLAGNLISNPVSLRGEAKGLWYFEASFPIIIVDANGKAIGKGVAQAEGDWQTDNFVSFQTTIGFGEPETSTGFIVFKKDNPSGLPENEQEVQLPVRFK